MREVVRQEDRDRDCEQRKKEEIEIVYASHKLDGTIERYGG
jgi:hypothetical protein